ncbi:MAG: DivIVA domain-containing protein [Thermoleophilaceae bacterium]
MELDRASIERRNFQQVRRGYDPAAVDRHLAEVADEADALQQTVEELQRDQDDRMAQAPTLSGAAAEQVRIIVEAAERSASSIETSARDEADRRGREAETRARELAGVTESRIQDLVSRVDQVTDLLLQRVDSVEGELSTLREGTRALASSLEGLGERTAPLRSEIEEMRTGVQELRDDPDAALGSSGSSPRGGYGGLGAEGGAVGVLPAEPDLDSELEPVIEPEDARAPGRRGGARGVPPEPRGAEEEIVPEATLEPTILPEEEQTEEAAIAAREEELAEAELEDDDVLVVEEVEVVEIEEEEVPVGDAGGSEEEEEGARLVALNMALNGVPRDETDRYLAENFSLSDRSTVLDDVYARVGEA